MNENLLVAQNRHETATYGHYLANAVMPVAGFAIENGLPDPKAC
jgi:hypothetical protein